MEQTRNGIKSGIRLFIVGFFVLIALYPIFWLLLSAFKAPDEFSLQPVYALPKKIYVQNFVEAWTSGNMAIFFKNSVIATFSALLLIVGFSAPASFAMTKMKWRYQGKAQMLFMLGIMIPVQVVLIPVFAIFKNLKLINSLTGLILVYAAFGLSMSVFLFCGYLKGIPNELMESAVIDGCSVYQLFTKIMLPLLTNAAVTVITLQFLFTWNDLIWAQTLLSDTNLKTVQVGLMMFTGEYGQRDWGPTFASIVIGTLPTLVLYLFLSKFLIKGMTAGAVKG